MKNSAAAVAKVILKQWREERNAIIREFQETLHQADQEHKRTKDRLDEALRNLKKAVEVGKEAQDERDELLKRVKDMDRDFTDSVHQAVECNVNSALNAAAHRAVLWLVHESDYPVDDAKKESLMKVILGRKPE